MDKNELNERAIDVLTKFDGVEPYWQEENKDYSSKNFQGEVLLMNKNNFNVSIHLTNLFDTYNGETR